MDYYGELSRVLASEGWTIASPERFEFAFQDKTGALYFEGHSTIETLLAAYLESEDFWGDEDENGRP